MILINNLFLKYVRQYYALYDINLKIEEGETVAFIGERESGKTSLLRILAKVEKATKGEVYIKDIPLSKINFAEDINVGFLPLVPVFFENKTVYENFVYVLKIQKQKVSEMESKINEILIDFNLEGLKDIKVSELSLFEKYVISIARLCFRELDLVMIDNILDNLADDEREKLIEIINKKFNNKKTTLIVSTANEDFTKNLCKRRIYFKSGSIVGDKGKNERLFCKLCRLQGKN